MTFENKTLKEYPVKRRVNTSRKTTRKPPNRGQQCCEQNEENTYLLFPFASQRTLRKRKISLLEEKLTLSSHRRITETICRGFRTGKS